MSYCTVCGNGAGEINYAAFAGKEVCPACGTPSIERMNRFLANLLPAQEPPGFRIHNFGVPAEDAEVLALCEKHGFGAVMASASRQWRARDPKGAKSVGDCFGTLANTGRPEIDAIERRLKRIEPWEPGWDFEGMTEEDKTFAGHACKDVPALIAYIRKLEARSPEAAGADKGPLIEDAMRFGDDCANALAAVAAAGLADAEGILRDCLMTAYSLAPKAAREGKEGDGSGEAPSPGSAPEIREAVVGILWDMVSELYRLPEPENETESDAVAYGAADKILSLLERSSVSPLGVGEERAGSEASPDASRQIRENMEAVNFTMALWEPSEYIICLCGKPVGNTLTPHDANVILAWLKVAWREITEDMLKVSPAAPKGHGEAQAEPSKSPSPLTSKLPGAEAGRAEA